MANQAQLADGLFVSHETVAKLREFENLLKIWQKKINLISSRDLDSIWDRHVIDSAQLISSLPKPPKKILDLGSGGGFPGVVLGLLGYQVTMVESDTRKTIFLQEAKRVLSINAEILNARIEEIPPQMPNIITARGLTELSELFKLSKRFVSHETILCFMKGASWKKEVEEAEKKWEYEINPVESITSKDARILIIQNLTRKK